MTTLDKRPPVDFDAWLERAAVLEYEAGLSRGEAELRAFVLTVGREPRAGELESLRRRELLVFPVRGAAA